MGRAVAGGGDGEGEGDGDWDSDVSYPAEDDVGLAVRRIGQNVGAASQSLGRSELTPIYGRHVLSR